MSAKVKIVAVSDTHGKHAQLALPPGDVLVHCGDHSEMAGDVEEFGAFVDWLGSQPHPHKVMIAGNHDFAPKQDLAACRKRIPPSVTFLHDAEARVAGLRFYGSPWTPRFFNWAFMLERGESIRAKWEKIPAGIDVLVTHGPPHGQGDEAPAFPRLSDHPRSVGCLELLLAVKRVRPQVHLFGHVHEGYGISVSDEVPGTTFGNAASCTTAMEPTNPPIVLEVAPR